MKLKKKICIQYLIAFTLLTGSFSWMYNKYFSTEHNISSAGPQENYAWTIAKFAIRLAEFEARTERQLRLTSLSNSDMKMELDFLFSGSNVLMKKGDATQYLYKEQGYDETISSIHQMLEVIDNEMKKNKPNYNIILSTVNKIKDKNTDLIFIADHAEVNQRTAIFEDYLKKGDSFKIPIIVTYILLLIMLVISFRQLTTLNRLLESEKKAFNNKNAFLGKLGHELRTTLQAIVGSIESIIYSPQKAPDQNTLHRLENAVSQIERQMNDLAEYAKIDNGALKINKSTINVADLVTKVVNDCNAKYTNKNIEASVVNLPSVNINTDGIRLSQILENLLTNAFKYTEQGSITVDVTTNQSHHSSYLHIKISDTGIGIDKEKQKIIFQPFVRIENGSSLIPGSGMGLAIVEGIVKAMDGKISVISEPGKGSIFTVSLPVEINSIDSTTNSTPLNVMETSLKGLSVLHIDDSELTCRTMASTLRSVGYRAESTSSVNRAIEKLMRIPYDIILCDLQMPIMTGDELVDYIRTREGPNRNTPVIFISAYPDNYLHAEIPLIVKPARIADINNEISKAIR
ncbi:TPA: hybrid sensor histidine kinase/response regulator [Klebsiella pneumoniae]|uniref:ATP-binding response regulator n=1 Tax=Klebsiella pneumoniae complex TaxID=3390273 RepID=UPI001090E6BC|nr:MULTISPECIES: hybrid sensor histidine kinase/response regulator [Klebsiella]EKV6277104.1 hybrid sensor histidine kinase/response regulator [Klebsiella pneumoniae]MDP0806328.1 hybrid sensor histidine kinase/response regulator [Klebsiella variicola]VGD22596.1 Signal transduction histidine kinase [Klebsiella pneumoniae]HDK6343166.1 hybrid sensor histidine kinase/response regulator [Klebsiella pneumoniae]